MLLVQGTFLRASALISKTQMSVFDKKFSHDPDAYQE